jgi:hypothetical protein
MKNQKGKIPLDPPLQKGGVMRKGSFTLTPTPFDRLTTPLSPQGRERMNYPAASHWVSNRNVMPVNTGIHLGFLLSRE